MSNSPIDNALRQFEATEANLEKLERVYSEIRSLIPDGISFEKNHEYDELCRVFHDILTALPKIDGWSPKCTFLDLNEIAQARFDAWEVGEPSATFYVEEAIEAPLDQLYEYRSKFNRKRKQLIKKALSTCMAEIDNALRELSRKIDDTISPKTKIDDELISDILVRIAEIDTLLGNSVDRPLRWSDLRRHLHFALKHDIEDVISLDWPNVNSWLSKNLYDKNEPIKVEVNDLGDLARQEPTGTVITKLNWELLTPENFERIVFDLISDAPEYENPEWLMQTNAPDKGRDLSAIRVSIDSLSGVLRKRVIIQCKHLLKKSIAPIDISTLKEQVTLWEPPRVDVLIIVTSGRFTGDAVALIEKHNLSNNALTIEMWPESHLELLLAKRPSLIAEYKLK